MADGAAAELQHQRPAAVGDTRLTEIDETIAKLPGMEWFNLVSRATNEGTERCLRAGTNIRGVLKYD